MNQRQMEQQIYRMLGAYLDGMDWQELTDETDVHPITTAQEDRFSKAINVVGHQLWERARVKEPRQPQHPEPSP